MILIDIKNVRVWFYHASPLCSKPSCSPSHPIPSMGGWESGRRGGKALQSRGWQSYCCRQAFTSSIKKIEISSIQKIFKAVSDARKFSRYRLYSACRNWAWYKGADLTWPIRLKLLDPGISQTTEDQVSPHLKYTHQVLALPCQTINFAMLQCCLHAPFKIRAPFCHCCVCDNHYITIKYLTG